MTHRYYHGTSLKSAVDRLLAGEPLLPARPLGKSKELRSRQGMVYLTPSFNQAAEYAFMRDRSDWPDVDRAMFSETPHVFEFANLSEDLEPDEDELGFAFKVALCRRAGKRHEWSINSGFATALTGSQRLLDSLWDIAASQMTDAKSIKFFEQPETIKRMEKARIGHRLRSALNPILTQEIIDLGISVATRSMETPVAAFSLPTRVMNAVDAVELWRVEEPKPTSGSGTLTLARCGR